MTGPHLVWLVPGSTGCIGRIEVFGAGQRVNRLFCEPFRDLPCGLLADGVVEVRKTARVAESDFPLRLSQRTHESCIGQNLFGWRKHVPVFGLLTDILRIGFGRTVGEYMVAMKCTRQPSRVLISSTGSGIFELQHRPFFVCPSGGVNWTERDKIFLLKSCVFTRPDTPKIILRPHFRCAFLPK